ncbi:dienelactone hydrolase family protein [Pseudomonas fluorescens]|uniref:dienelactone hydrolase family protein n=1 Tax=Pseudomonas fluorescens TaxID=294 RepID=UPI0017857587|nr:dienelactone hydrolase family protein [Pseudomonas fluorescens]
MPPRSRTNIHCAEIPYTDARGESLQGFYAHDQEDVGLRPGVLVVHEWWGPNDYAHSRARQLAALGYRALAVDMYGRGSTTDAGQAGEWMRIALADPVQLRERFEAGLQLLRQQPGVDPRRIAAIGYCFGGRVVLDMARQGLDLAGVASIHGLLRTELPAQRGSLRAKILVAHGDADLLVDDAEVQRFEAEMRHAGADLWLRRYPAASHGFSNPASSGYQEEAERRSWADVQAFFETLFADAVPSA